MSLKKRKDGRYEKSLTIDGKRYHFYGKTIKEVNNKIFEHKTKQRNGPLFSELLEEYERQYLEDHPANRKYIKAHIKRLSEFFKGRYRKDLKPKDFSGLFMAMYPLSYKTMSNCRMVASGRYVYGMTVLGLEENPVELSKIPTFRRKGHREPPTPEEIEKIKQYHDTEEDLFMLVRLYTGLRRGEILALQYKDIDFDNAFIVMFKLNNYFDIMQDGVFNSETSKDRHEGFVVLLEPYYKLERLIIRINWSYYDKVLALDFRIEDEGFFNMTLSSQLPLEVFREYWSITSGFMDSSRAKLEMSLQEAKRSIETHRKAIEMKERQIESITRKLDELKS